VAKQLVRAAFGQAFSSAEQLCIRLQLHDANFHTEIPQFLHEAGWTAGGRKVACTQPRRVAAASVAARVADEMHCKLGSTVGYRVRFEDMSTEGQTRIMFVTDGMLLRETLRDPLLTQYSVIMLDEAHERNANTDLLLALLKRILPKRPDLRVVVASATLQAEQFAAFFSSSDPVPSVSALPSSAEGLPSAPSAGGGSRKSRWGPSTAMASTSFVQGSRVGGASDAAGHHGRAVVMQVPGRVHPVDVEYLKAPCSDFMTATVQTVLDVHLHEGPGDILVFLPTSESIESVVEQLREQAHGPAHNSAAARMAAEHRNLLSGKRGAVLQVQPLYAALSPAAQMAALAPAASPDGAGRPVRKCVVATNIAETSVTIDGVVYVVDAGFVNLPVFNPLTGLDAHIIQPTSKAAADQRAGRAGRTRPGKCFRLYTQLAHAGLAVASIPDVLRVRLEGFVLQLKALGVRNVARFPLLTRPFPLTLMRALENLQALGALTRPAGELVRPMGEFLAEFPAQPEVAAMLMWSLVMGCAEEAVTIAAVLGVKSIYAHGTAAAQRTTAELPALAAVQGDLLSYVNVYKAWEEEGFAKEFAVQRGLQFLTLRRVRQVRAQLRRYVSRLLAAARQRWDEAGRPQDEQEASRAVQRERADTVAPPAADGGAQDEAALWPCSITLGALAQAELVSCEDDTEVLQRCICRAFFASSAQRQRDGTYVTLKDARRVRVHPRSVLHRFSLAPQWIVFTEALLTDDEYVLHCSAVQQSWLMRSAPHFFKLVDRAGAGKWASDAQVTERDMTRAAATDGKAMPGVRVELEDVDAVLQQQYLALAAPDAGSNSTALAKYATQQGVVVYDAGAGMAQRGAGGLTAAAVDTLSAVDAMWASGDSTAMPHTASRSSAAHSAALPAGTSAASLLSGVRGGREALEAGPTFVPQRRPEKRPRQGKRKQDRNKRATGLAGILAHLRNDLQDDEKDDF